MEIKKKKKKLDLKFWNQEMAFLLTFYLLEKNGSKKKWDPQMEEINNLHETMPYPPNMTYHLKRVTCIINWLSSTKCRDQN